MVTPSFLPKDSQVAIIGGGPGGLFTAHLLQERLPGHFKIFVYESTERLGGKLITHRLGDEKHFEAGAAELYDYSQLGVDPLRELITKLGLATLPLEGGPCFLDGKLLVPSPNGVGLDRDSERAISKFYRDARKHISPAEYYESDWQLDSKDPLGRMPFSDLLGQVSSEKARQYLRIMVHSDLACEPEETNAAYGLQNCLMDEPDYMKTYSIKGGNDRLVQELAGRLNAGICLGTEVRAVREVEGGQLELEFADLSRRKFAAVVVCLPLNALKRIRWEGSALSPTMSTHIAHYDHPAHYLRVTLRFSVPFWRTEVNTAYFMTDAFGGCCLYDESARCGATEGLLSCLLAGNDAKRLASLSDSDIIKELLAQLPSRLGVAAHQPLQTWVHRWIESVNALPGGFPLQDPEIRHCPDYDRLPHLNIVGDYLFDSTINGVLDSAEYAAANLCEMAGHSIS